MHRKLYIPILVLAFLAIGLELLSINLSGKIASDSITVKKLQTSIARLNEENQILNSKVLDQTSFEMIASKAASLGFIEDHSYISLRNQSNLSYSQ
jgi:cell division protein FtsL